MMFFFRHDKAGVVALLIGAFVSFFPASFAYGQEPSVGLITGFLEDRADWGITILNTMEVNYTIIEKGGLPPTPF